MARAKSSSSGMAYAAALVLFGTGFLLCLILAILFYTRDEGLRQDADQANQQLDTFVNRAQRDSSTVTNLKSNLEANHTVVGTLLDNSRKLKALIAGDPDLTVDAIQKQKSKAGIDRALFAAVNQREQKIQALKDQVKAKDQAVAQARKRADDAKQQLDAQAKKFAQAKKQLKQAYVSTETNFTSMTKGQTDAWDALKKQFASKRSDLQAQMTKKDSKVDELQQRLQVLKQRVSKMRKEKSQTIGPPDVVPADGQVVQVLPNSDKVYINRGSKDYLQRGMTFEVFNPDKNIKLNNYDELRGKATIEVVSLNDQSAVARVVRTEPNSKISKDDQIANLVYNPHATYKFYIYGDFNIGDKGEPSTRDRRRIKSMVSRWGGEVADKLNWSVDFLVLGKEPPVPEPLDPNELDPEVIKRHDEAVKKFKTYQKLQAKARDLSIPVLNQNRFLALVGYYRR